MTSISPIKLLAALLVTLVTAPLTDVGAQESRDPRRTGPRAPLPIEREVALARSAAPPSVSDSATVYVFTDSGYVVAQRGTNGVGCYVSRAWPASIEPHCFDAEGAATVMPIHMHEVLLLHRGSSPAAAEAAIASAVANGHYRLPTRPAVSYMMSAEQELISDDGRPVGRWRPHLMIYYPFLDGSVGGGRETDPEAAFVSGAGTWLSSIIIIAREFVPVRDAVVSSP